MDLTHAKQMDQTISTAMKADQIKDSRFAAALCFVAGCPKARGVLCCSFAATECTLWGPLDVDVSPSKLRVNTGDETQ